MGQLDSRLWLGPPVLKRGRQHLGQRMWGEGRGCGVHLPLPCQARLGCCGVRNANTSHLPTVINSFTSFGAPWTSYIPCKCPHFPFDTFAVALADLAFKGPSNSVNPFRNTGCDCTQFSRAES